MIVLRAVTWAGHVSRMGKKLNIYIVLVENTKHEYSCRWEDNIKKNLEDVKYFFGSEEGPAAGSDEGHNEALGCIKGGEVLE
jgi:hypothetical protein